MLSMLVVSEAFLLMTLLLLKYFVLFFPAAISTACNSPPAWSNKRPEMCTIAPEISERKKVTESALISLWHDECQAATHHDYPEMCKIHNSQLQTIWNDAKVAQRMENTQANTHTQPI